MNFTMYTRFSDIIAESGIEKAAEYAKNLSFTSVEMFEAVVAGGKYVIPDVSVAKDAKAALKERGLSVACYSVYADIWQSEETVNNLMRLVEIAGEIGSPYFHHTLLPKRVLQGATSSYEEGIKAAVKELLK